jgi:VanZ family protein
MSFLDRLLRNGAHAPVYAIFSSLLLLALAPRQGSGPTARAFGQALAVAVLYALSDEGHQHFVPGRAASLIDVATDGFGAACGLSVLRWTLGGGEPGGLALASLALAGGVASALLATTGFLGI